MDLKQTCKIAREKWVAMMQERNERFLSEQRLLKQGKVITKKLPGGATVTTVRARSRHAPFWATVVEFQAGDPFALAEYLRSDCPLSAFDREFLAKIVEETIVRGQFWKPWRGRRKKPGVRTGTYWALEFYDVWRAVNKKRGVNDYGRRRYMRDEAAKVAIEYLRVRNKNFPAVRISTVQDMMGRPKARRQKSAAGNSSKLFGVPTARKGRW